MKISSKLLEKYAQNNCSTSEILIIEQWLETNDDIVLSNDFNGRGKDLWNKIDKRTQSKSKLIKISLVAATIVVLLGFTAFQYIFHPKKTTYKTLAGQIKTISLDDGTLVYLNANSTLVIPNEFKKGLRTILLKGEAYFEVAKDSLHPFIVETNTSFTQVLGTQFNLSAYTNKDVILTLNEGKVLFKNKINSQKLILFPDEQAMIKNDSLIKIKVNSKNYSSWILHKMYLNNESFTEVIHKIEQTYNVHFLVKKGKIKNYICRGKYNNTSLNEVLKDLSFVLKFNYKIEGKIVTIY